MEAAGAGEYYISSTLHRPGKRYPLYVHRKGSNVKNGVYYVDQNIEKDHRSLQFGSLYQHRCSERGLCPDVDLVQRGSDKRFSIGAGYLHFSEEVLLSVAPPVWQKRNICRSTDKVAHKRRVLALAYQADFQFL